MIHLIQREFIVEAPLAIAWRHLAQVENWPAWAKHIKRLKLFPPGELTPQSHGMIYLRNGVRSDFQMTEFNWHHNWKWSGPFLWLTVHYDHRFETLTDGRTKITFIIFKTLIKNWRSFQANMLRRRDVCCWRWMIIRLRGAWLYEKSMTRFAR